MATPITRPMIAPVPNEESCWSSDSWESCAAGIDAEETELIGAVDEAVENESVVAEVAVVEASVSELRVDVVVGVEESESEADVLSSSKMELDRAEDVGAGPIAVMEPTTSPSGSLK